MDCAHNLEVIINGKSATTPFSGIPTVDELTKLAEALPDDNISLTCEITYFCSLHPREIFKLCLSFPPVPNYDFDERYLIDAPVGSPRFKLNLMAGIVTKFIKEFTVQLQKLR